MIVQFFSLKLDGLKIIGINSKEASEPGLSKEQKGYIFICQIGV
jgi:hypothetical protein